MLHRHGHSANGTMSLFKVLPPPSFDPVGGMSSRRFIPGSCFSAPDPEANKPQKSRNRRRAALCPTEGLIRSLCPGKPISYGTRKRSLPPPSTRKLGLGQDRCDRKHVHQKISAGPFGQHVLEIPGGKINFTVKEVVQGTHCESETLGEG